MSLQHELDQNVFKRILSDRGMSQSALASELAINEKTFSRWINKGYPSDKIMVLRKQLNLSRQDFRSLLKIPEYKIFFRNKFMAEVPEQSTAKAVEWAKVALNSTPLARSSKLLNLDLSSSTDPEAVALAIQGILNNALGASFDDYVAALSRDGIEVAVIPFSRFSLNNSKEQAFSVYDGKSRAVVFLNADCNRPALVWNLIHELCHLVRLKANQGKAEEQFCQEVAELFLYPRAFFIADLDSIKSVIEGGNADQSLLEELSDQLNASPFGVALRLKKLGLLGGRRNKLIAVGRKLDNSMPRVSDLNYSNSALQGEQDWAELFWDDLDFSNTYNRFFNKIRIAVAEYKMTPRRFSELFNIDLAVATVLSNEWRDECLMDEANAENHSD